jgi:mono/diheme cytochrome c family protein
MTRPALALLALAAALVALAACGSARRGAPLVGPHEPPTPEVALGQRTFDTFCNGCHPGGTAGVGVALNNKPLPGLVIRRQVRWGLGAMPAFGDETISDEELDALVAYLHWLRGLDVPDGALTPD